jgi:hypothetical protein
MNKAKHMQLLETCRNLKHDVDKLAGISVLVKINSEVHLVLLSLERNVLMMKAQFVETNYMLKLCIFSQVKHAKLLIEVRSEILIF